MGVWREGTEGYGEGMEGTLTSNFVPIVYKLLENYVNLYKCPQLVAMLKDF